MKNRIALVRLTSLAREGSWVAAGQALEISGMLIVLRVLTETLDPEEYGRLALGLTIVSCVGQIFLGGVGSGIGRFYPVAKGVNALCTYFGASFKLVAYATFAVAVAGSILLAGLVAISLYHWVGLAAAALLFAVFTGWSSILNRIQNAARRRNIVACYHGLHAILKIVLVIGATHWFALSSTTVVLCFASAALLTSISQLVHLRQTTFCREPQSHSNQRQQNWQRTIWLFSWPYCIWGAFTWLQQISDRWALQSFTSTHDLGLYAVVFQLGYTPMLLLTGLAMTLIEPIVYQRAGAVRTEGKSAARALIWQSAAFAGLITAAAFLGTSVVHKALFHMLVSPPYRSVSYLLPWAVLAGGLFAIGQLISLHLSSQLRSVQMLVPKTITAILGVALNFAGAALAGLNGVITGLVGFSVTYLIWIAILAIGIYRKGPRPLSSARNAV